MGRLIDADELLKEFDPNGERLDPILVRSRIVQQPTAYDVEKVVERLEKERICLEDNYGDQVICIGARDAINIVKRGGLE